MQGMGVVSGGGTTGVVISGAGGQGARGAQKNAVWRGLASRLVGEK